MGRVMANLNPAYWWQRLLALPNDSRTKTLAVAMLVALSAAVLVSTASVLLRPIQEENRERERQAQITALVSAAIGDVGPLQARVVDLSTGNFEPDIDAVTFDQREAARDQTRSVAIPTENDFAGLGRRAKHARIFIQEVGSKIDLIVLPVHGLGYQSLLSGYLALRGDFNTVAALSFYDQGETPGLGSRITEANWQTNWRDRKIADESGAIRITVARGKAEGPFEVDGISGATRTGQGVSNMLRYWLGKHGFGPLLDRLRKESS